MSSPQHSSEGSTDEQEVTMDAEPQHDTEAHHEAENDTHAIYVPRQIPAPRSEDDAIGHTESDRPSGAEDGSSAGPVIEGELVDDDRDGRPDRFGHDRPATPVDRSGSDEDRSWSQIARERFADRPALLPGWAKSTREFREQAAFVSKYAAHASGYHALRSPKYAARLAARSPRGFKRVSVSTVRWVFDLENAPMRREAVRNLDHGAHSRLHEQRRETVRKRLIVLSIVGAGLLTIALVLTFAAGTPVKLAALAAAVGLLGIIGRKPDDPVIGRAVVNHGVTKLTSDVVVRALGGLGIGGINQALSQKGSGVTFPSPITRDGPGYRAEVDLPYGVTADDIMERRGKLASGLRRPLGCVWPEGDRDVHEGRLVLWVGDKDMNKTKQPAWPLAKGPQTDVFKPQPFGTDQRGRWVYVTLMHIAGIIGAIPRMGKTFTLRLWLTIAALDPRVQLHCYDLKGTGDLDALEGVSHRHRAGDDEDDIEYALADLRELRKEFRRRAKVIKGLPQDVCPDKQVSPALAGKKSLGLHPIVIGVDECQMWFEHEKHGAEFEAICTDLVKRGPAVGITLLLATQRPDAKSIPTGISANAPTRLCLKVNGQTENDMVLGVSKYKQGIRATTFAWNDKGIGYFLGEGSDATITRSVYKDGPATLALAKKARALREKAGTITGHAAGQTPEVNTTPSYALIEDVAAILADGETKVWSEVIVDRLAELRPDAYGQWATGSPREKASTLAAALKPYGVATAQVHGQLADGSGTANRRGITREAVLAALTKYRQTHGGTTDSEHEE